MIVLESELSDNEVNTSCIHSMVGLHTDVNTMLVHSFMQHLLSVSDECNFWPSWNNYYWQEGVTSFQLPWQNYSIPGHVIHQYVLFLVFIFTLRTAHILMLAKAEYHRSGACRIGCWTMWDRLPATLIFIHNAQFLFNFYYISIVLFLLTWVAAQMCERVLDFSW